MKKVSEFQDEDSIEVLADLLDPIGTICQDERFLKDLQENFKKGSERPRLLSYALKNFKHEIFCMLAVLEGVPVEEYHCNLMTLPARILDILNDVDLMSYFLSSAEKEEKTSSGSATGNTEGKEQ